ncbi:MAG: hypothetical protein JWQ32_1951 [Marmoricola sp.]|nr:hypothetical protein [Marmoricola sp.]
MADVHELTSAYESWLGARIPLEQSELDRKHAEMAAHEYRFLRGSYYLWLVRIGELLPETLDSTRLPAVGDLHVENFGTWRDRDQVRRWGINDFDELATGAHLPDLVRLATSAVLAPHITLADKDVCRVVLEAWSSSAPRVAVDLEEKGAGHLRTLVPGFDDADRFYERLAEGAPAQVPPAVAAAAMGVAENGWTPTWHVHLAGTGSLGHRRVVGVGPSADGTQHAREAKQLGPGTSEWLETTKPGHPWPTTADALFERVRSAIRGPAAAVRVEGWHVRDLAPDIVRIELAGLDHHDSERLLTAMAQATADVHGCDPERFAQAIGAADALGTSGFRDAVETMVASTKADYAAYRA